MCTECYGIYSNCPMCGIEESEEEMCEKERKADYYADLKMEMEREYVCPQL